MIVFKSLEVPTPLGPAVVQVSGAIHRVPAIGPAAAAGVVEFHGGHIRHRVAGQLVFARVPAAEFVREFPESGPLADSRQWALVPLSVSASRHEAMEFPCRMVGPPTFGHVELPDPG